MAKRVTDEECEAYLKEKWLDVLSRRMRFFCSGKHETVVALLIEEAVERLASIYQAFRPFKDKHFNKQIMQSGHSYEQRMSEILFYYHLLRSGFTEISSASEGPDFFAKKEGKSYCFEVVTPTPDPEHFEWVCQGRNSSADPAKMYNHRCLRIASAINRKKEDYLRYLEKGLITGNEYYIIVMNDTLMHPYDEPWFGVNISQPLAIGLAATPALINVTHGAVDLRFNTDQPFYLHNNLGVEHYKESEYISDSGLKINGVKPIEPSITLLRRKFAHSPSGGKVDVAVLEDSHINGYYQITLREDLVLMDRISANIGQGNATAPSALAVKVNDAPVLSTNIPHISLYHDRIPFTQVMDPFILFGLKSSEMFSKGLSGNLDFIQSRLEGLLFFYSYCIALAQR